MACAGGAGAGGCCFARGIGAGGVRAEEQFKRGLKDVVGVLALLLADKADEGTS